MLHCCVAAAVAATVAVVAGRGLLALQLVAPQRHGTVTLSATHSLIVTRLLVVLGGGSGGSGG